MIEEVDSLEGYVRYVFGKDIKEYFRLDNNGNNYVDIIYKNLIIDLGEEHYDLDDPEDVVEYNKFRDKCDRYSDKLYKVSEIDEEDIGNTDYPFDGGENLEVWVSQYLGVMVIGGEVWVRKSLQEERDDKINKLLL